MSILTSIMSLVSKQHKTIYASLEHWFYFKEKVDKNFERIHKRWNLRMTVVGGK